MRSRFWRPVRWPRSASVPPAPALEPGETIGAPDYVGVGVQKAGTSWWYSLVLAHPAVQPVARKELHYFDHYFEHEFASDHIDAYHRLFPRAPGRITGEWTPRYMYDPWTASLLHRAAPSCRLLVLLRDPIERFRSGLTHDLARGAPHHPIVAGDAIQRGLYAQQLLGLLRWFSQEQMLILQYESCSASPRVNLKRTYDFLGVERSDFFPERVENRVNVTRTTKAPMTSDLLRVLTEFYEPDIATLRKLVPALDLSLWPNFAHLHPM